MSTSTGTTARKRRGLLVGAAVAGLACALALTGAPATPAWAANGTITVTLPAGTQSSTELTYKLFKVFDAYGNGTNVRYEVISSDTTVGTATIHAKTGLPDVATVVGTDYNASTDAHFILDNANNVHYGTEFATEEAAQAAAAGQTGVTTSQVTINDPDNAGQTKDIWVNTPASLSADAITAIATYVAGDDPVQTITGTAGTATTVSFNDVDDGYYYITTATGTAVTVTTNNPNASVTDKNVVPSVDKTITQVQTGTETTGSIDTAGTNGQEGAPDGDKSDNAIAQVGSTVSYEAEILVGNGTKLIAFHDGMEEGLALDEDAITVTFYTGAGTDDDPYSQATTENPTQYYTIRANQDGIWGTQADPSADDPDEGDTFTVDFTDALFTLSSGGHKISRIVVSYSAVVTSDALATDPATNTAKVTYGDNHSSTTEDSTNVYNATINVKKTDASGTTLAGAGFVLTRTVTVGETPTTQYYKFTPADAEAGTTATVTWVTDQAEATELMSSDDGKLYPVKTTTTTTTDPDDPEKTTTTTTKEADTSKPAQAFSGLTDGTYTLVESTVPRGYNKAADTTVTIDGASVTEALSQGNLQRDQEIVNRTGSTLPSTGGIGTTVLYVVGGLLVVGAGVALVTKRKMDRQGR